MERTCKKAQIKRPSIVLLEDLGSRAYEVIGNLEAVCFEHGREALKLELAFKRALAERETGGIGEINEFLYYDGKKLIGYLGICGYGGESLEICGMTHPAYRCAGVFGKLFSLARDEVNKRGAGSALLLCDRNSDTGQRFIGNTGATFHHSEHEMLLEVGQEKSAAKRTVVLRNAFAVESRESGLETACTKCYLAEAEGVAVGRVRLEILGAEGGIYGLEARPEHRGKGYGRAILLGAVEKLWEGGAKRIRLQVDTANEAALHVYESCGFKIAYTMDYYKLP
jgi:RimJ/RimL family protein N-acetyltransferase